MGRKDLIKGGDDEQGCVFCLSSLLVLSLGLLVEMGQLLALSTVCSRQFARDLQDLGNPAWEPGLPACKV